MSDAQYLLLLRIYTQDKTVQQKLFYQIYDHAIGIAARDRWRVPVGKELVRKMTALALAEVIEPRACPKCNGKGEVWLRSRSMPTLCDVCDGGGRKPPTLREKAAALGLEESNFAKRWRDKYEQIFYYVVQLNMDGLRTLKKRL